MTRKPLTAEQRERIRQGVKSFYNTPEGQAEKANKRGRAPGNKGKPGPEPWNKGLKGAVSLSPEARQKVSDNSTQKKAVRQLTKKGEFIKVWPSIAEAIEALGLSYTAIWYCTTGRRKTAGGYKWENDN